MRRRGKGEASFLHCKSPGREEADVKNRGRTVKKAKRNKTGENEKKKRGGKELEVEK